MYLAGASGFRSPQILLNQLNITLSGSFNGDSTTESEKKEWLNIRRGLIQMFVASEDDDECTRRGDRSQNYKL